MLLKAKSHKSEVETVMQKRAKKQKEDKPTLTVCKLNGQYHVELQATPAFPEECLSQLSPLIYTIESLDRKAKLKKKDYIKKKLVEAAVNEAWSDPFHTEACENKCLPAYNLAVGFSPEIGDYNKIAEEEIYSGSCLSDDEVSSSCNSSEVDWEIHFTPPISCQKPSKGINYY